MRFQNKDVGNPLCCFAHCVLTLVPSGITFTPTPTAYQPNY